MAQKPTDSPQSLRQMLNQALQAYELAQATRWQAERQAQAEHKRRQQTLEKQHHAILSIAKRLVRIGQAASVLGASITTRQADGREFHGVSLWRGRKEPSPCGDGGTGLDEAGSKQPIYSGQTE